LSISILLFVGCIEIEPIPEQDKSFESVYQIPNSSKDTIYNNTRIWMAENFRSSKDVIDYENKEEGILIGNGSMAYPHRGLTSLGSAIAKVSFSMRVDMKNDKFKLTFSKIKIYEPYDHSTRDIYNKKELNLIKAKLLVFGNELQESVNKNQKSKDW
jgi:hypothetical protein